MLDIVHLAYYIRLKNKKSSLVENSSVLSGNELEGFKCESCPKGIAFRKVIKVIKIQHFRQMVHVDFVPYNRCPRNNLSTD